MPSALQPSLLAPWHLQRVEVADQTPIPELASDEVALPAEVGPERLAAAAGEIALADEAGYYKGVKLSGDPVADETYMALVDTDPVPWPEKRREKRPPPPIANPTYNEWVDDFTSATEIMKHPGSQLDLILSGIVDLATLRAGL